MTEQSDRPSWFDRPPVRYTEIGVGTIKAAEEKNAYRWDIPVALISLWGDGAQDQSQDDETTEFYTGVLDMVLSAVQAYLILGSFTQSEKRAQSYRSHLKDWVIGIRRWFPEVQPKPSWHLAFHIYDFILLFGPLMSWWLFPFERLIGHLQKIPQNHRYQCESNSVWTV